MTWKKCNNCKKTFVSHNRYVCVKCETAKYAAVYGHISKGKQKSKYTLDMCDHSMGKSDPNDGYIGDELDLTD